MSLPDFRYKQMVFHFSDKAQERIRFHADNIVIEDQEGTALFQHSCHRIFALIIVGHTTLTDVALRKSKQFGFPILVLSAGSFRPTCVVNNSAEGNTLLRQKQYACGARSHVIAQALIGQKIGNQMALLKALRAKAEADKDAVSVLEEFMIASQSAPNREALMGIEGSASRAFFAAYFRPLKWRRREPRCRRDTTNFLLDIGYTHLFNFVSALLSLYGFDLYCGVHHTFFYHRMSLVCDMVEPFRCIIDRRVRKAHNLGQIDEKDFMLTKAGYTLAWKQQAKYVSLFMKDILEEKEKVFLYIQQYYRWFIRDEEKRSFPIYHIEGE